ncbi:spondin-1 [Frankliniella occidentalis]|uniref:Spondin-1 n=1 Tax=Frankliniella occidentalis TaxID=133901 RepID=A0A6J1SEK6_FRAOC|nr:spondin-1 [Frankliniella occidentalis]
MWRCAVLALVLALAVPCRPEQCVLEPPVGVTNSLRSPGDGGFALHISGDPERYVSGSVYTISISAPAGKTFRRFLLTVEPAEAEAVGRRWAGSFQLFQDPAVQFHPMCINAVSEGETPEPAARHEVQTMWRAPTSGCVRFKAMVQEDEALWFAEEGALGVTLCDLVAVPEAAAESDTQECCACDEAKYKFIFQGIWSSETHPKDYPTFLWLTHFSDVIGASHEANFTFWGEGQIASDGFRQLAEWGSVGWLERELRAKSQHLRSLIKAGGLWHPRVNQNTSATFNVDKRRHLVSLASMFGPSPDWVVGVSGLNLCQADCSWLESKVIDLYPIDAGTDSGITYMSPNAPTVPREEMYRITTMYPEDPRAPFYDPSGAPMQPLARLYITREAVTSKPCGDDDDDIVEQTVFEDIETKDDGERPECRVDEWTPWSPCSVSCGKGLRMRTRNYQMDAKAQMLGCDKQLVQKEMCVAHEPSCPGDAEELDAAEQTNCAVTPWGPWSECSSSCGPGSEVRSRRFEDRLGLKKCPFIELTEKRKCSQPPCVDTVPVDPNCRLTDWSDWSPCSVSCGSGRKFRSRLVLVADEDLRERCARYHTLSEERPCSIKESCIISVADAEEACLQAEEPGPCRAYFERWYFDREARQCRPFGYGGCRGNRNNFHSLTECSTVCAGVREKLTRGEVLAPRSYSPAPDPPVVRAESVALRGPRVDCVVSEWSEWSECSASCGPGHRERTRRVQVEPIRGGRPCPPRLRQRRKCYGGPCDPFQAVEAEENL